MVMGDHKLHDFNPLDHFLLHTRIIRIMVALVTQTAAGTYVIEFGI